MDDFAPPVGPPPPRAPEVPAGWAARWNEQYKEWFYVNLYTKQSQWDKPTAPVFPAEDAPPSGAPPGYEPSNASIPTDTKKNPYDNHSVSGASYGGPSGPMSEDARLATQLQAEEDARARGGPGGAQPPPGYGSGSPYPQNNNSYSPSPNPYGQDMNRPLSQNSGAHGQSSSPFPQDLPAREKSSKGGFLKGLISKGKAAAASHQSSRPAYGHSSGGGFLPSSGYGHQGGYPGHGHHGQGGYMPQGGYGGYPGGHSGGHMGGPMMGGPMMGGGYGGYPPQRRAGGGGMGMAGGAALGVGAGLLGGAMIANAMDDDNGDYQDGFEDGADFGGDFDGGE